MASDRVAAGRVETKDAPPIDASFSRGFDQSNSYCKVDRSRTTRTAASIDTDG